MDNEERTQKIREKATAWKTKYNKLKQGQISEKYNSTASFVKLFGQSLGILELLGENDLRLLIYLTQFLVYETNALKYDNGTPITSKNLIENTNWARAKVYNSIKKLKDTGFLNQDTDRIFYVNPSFCANGVKMQLKTLDLFK